jgi:hypothetical protein
VRTVPGCSCFDRMVLSLTSQGVYCGWTLPPGKPAWLGAVICVVIWYCCSTHFVAVMALASWDALCFSACARHIPLVYERLRS